MSQEQLVSITVIKEQKDLSLQDFIQFRQIIQIDHVNSIQIPCSNFAQTINQQKVTVLNVFLYFIISVESNSKVLKYDFFGDNYRILCVKQISHYYIKNKMTIELRQYSFLAAVILNVKFHQCAHIIFYLIYGRFASHPYIKSLCGHVKGVNRINTKRKKTRFQSHFEQKRKSINLSSQSQFNEFYQELKETLQTKQKKIKSKRGIMNKKISEKAKSQFHYNQIQQLNEKKNLNQSSSSRVFLPLGIRQRQNSFVMQNLRFHNSYQTFGNSNNKDLMKKQRSNNLFSFNQLKQKQKTIKLLEQKKNQPRKIFNRSYNLASLEIGKIKIDDLHNISSQLRDQNIQFDQARLYCKFKENQTIIQQSVAKIQVEKQNKSNIILGHLQCKSEFKEEKLQISIIQKLKLSKKQKTSTQSKQLEYNNFLRLEETTRQSKKQQKQKKQSFAQTFFKWRSINCKQRVQAFKNQKRKFFSTQLLDKIISANQADQL